MKRVARFGMLVALLFFLACSSNKILSVNDILKVSDLQKLPTQDDYPDAGAVVLYENIQNRFYLDSEWDVNVEKTVQVAVLYFNDKAENWTRQSIYLNDEMRLKDFSAVTIKPDGTVLKLTEKDLHPTILNESASKVSEEKSVRFTFPGVEPGAILQYTYTVNYEGWFVGDYWFVQEDTPKIYSRYSVEIPAIFFRYGNNWTYFPNNFVLGKPIKEKNILTQKSDKDRSSIYYWEQRDIPALKDEPNSPPYFDIARYVSVDLQYDSWNDVSKTYWKTLKKYMNRQNDPKVVALSNEICQGATSEIEKIKRIFYYTQKNYHYLAFDIGKSGYVPHDVNTIIQNQYGDCKDMTVLNVNLLKAQGIKAYPALVATRSKIISKPVLYSLKFFNHMLTLVETSDGKNFWLDATGSSCPLGEIYPSIEGQYALVIFNNGKSTLTRIPQSQFLNNVTKRDITLNIHNDGSVEGHAVLFYTGNHNLSIRSVLKDASSKDMKKVMTRYLNSNTQDIELSNLKFTNPAEIADTFRVEFDFSKENFASSTPTLFIFNPTLFELPSSLDRFIDEKREYPIVFSEPFVVADMTTIQFDPQNFAVEGLIEGISKQTPFAGFVCGMAKREDGTLFFKRKYILTKTLLAPTQYDALRKLEKEIAKANYQKVVLKKK
jgi:hypothetical protein